jgi:glycosyltransferase involved in cell wall biosynthesis
VQLCGIELAPFEVSEEKSTVRSSLGIPADAFVIGHVGRFAPEKNHLFLLDVLKEVGLRDRTALFLLIGDGPLQETIQKRAEADGVSKRILFAGSRPDVPRLMLNAMDAFVLPSSSEGLGLVVVEAQAAGLPCVISDTVPEEVDVVPGLVRRRGLNEPPAMWAEDLLLCRKQQRLSSEFVLDLMRSSPLNIENSVRRLERAYLEAATHVSGQSLSA